MTAEIRDQDGRLWVVDLACALEEDWTDDPVGAALRVDEHNEAVHRNAAADPAPER